MDGIAISFKTFESGQREFLIDGTQTAGQHQQTLTNSTQGMEIMTGAPLPNGTDTVIPYENITIENKRAKILNSILKGQNVHPQGNDAKQNEKLLSPGFKISPADVALMASVGKSEVNVFKNPVAAVISTGDELVDVEKQPLRHQIRKSNSYAIAAALHEIGCETDVFHLADNEMELKEKMESIIHKYELVILSGGVSKGKFDFVPQVLESLGVKKLFHQVSQRPGKPMWFRAFGKKILFLPCQEIPSPLFYVGFLSLCETLAGKKLGT